MFSRSSEYAIRSLTYLALRDPRLFCLARTMAGELGIPAPFLGKVLQSLVAREILESHRGRTGGFRLARPAAHVRLAEIVAVFDDLLARRRCILGQEECSRECACPLHSSWCGVVDGLLAHLERTTLADLARYAREHPEAAFPYARRMASTGVSASLSTE